MILALFLIEILLRWVSWVEMSFVIWFFDNDEYFSFELVNIYNPHFWWTFWYKSKEALSGKTKFGKTHGY